MREKKNHIWEAYVRGDKNAVGELYSIYHEKLVLFLNGKLKDTFWAEEIASQTFERLIFKVYPDNIDDFEAYLYAIARNLCYDYYRKNGRRTSHQMKAFATMQIPEVEDAFAKENIAQELQPKEQEVWSLLNQGLWLEKIAEKIGRSLKTVYRSTSHIKQKLKDKA